MSFLNTLGKIAAIGGGALATGMTGGAASPLLMAAIGAAGSAGSVLGGQQGGANNARVAQAQLNQGHDINAINSYQAQQQAANQAAQLDLQRKGFESNDRSNTAKQAMISALIGGGISPTSISDGKASGGLLRSLNANPGALAAMQKLSGQAGTAQATPLAFTGGQQIQAPTLSKLPQIDTGNGFLSTLAKIGQLAGAASPLGEQAQHARRLWW